MRSDKALKTWYNKINKKFFDNELPRKTCVRWINDKEQEKFEEKYFAWTINIEGTNQDDGYHRYVIVISKNKNPGRTAQLASLAHEMVHVATGMRDDHGKAFSEWHEKLTERGLFRKGAVLRGLTLF